MPLNVRNLSPGRSPGGDTTLWKYLSFEKFLDFLLLKRLYFRRVDKLGDPYECLMPPEIAQARRSAGHVLVEDHERYLALERYKVFVNCWHQNDYESEAMWKLFGGGGHSLAIRSSFSRLASQLEGSGVAAGQVLYKDAIKDDLVIADIFDFALLKRKPFEHEREFRLIYVNEQGEDNPRLLDGLGLHLPVDPARVIESVYVSPLSEPWQFELTQTIIEREGLADRLIRSTLFNTPCQ